MRSRECRCDREANGERGMKGAHVRLKLGSRVAYVRVECRRQMRISLEGKSVSHPREPPRPPPHRPWMGATSARDFPLWRGGGGGPLMCRSTHERYRVAELVNSMTRTLSPRLLSPPRELPQLTLLVYAESCIQTVYIVASLSSCLSRYSASDSATSTRFRKVNARVFMSFIERVERRGLGIAEASATPNPPSPPEGRENRGVSLDA